MLSSTTEFNNTEVLSNIAQENHYLYTLLPHNKNNWAELSAKEVKYHIKKINKLLINLYGEYELDSRDSTVSEIHKASLDYAITSLLNLKHSWHRHAVSRPNARKERLKILGISPKLDKATVILKGTANNSKSAEVTLDDKPDTNQRTVEDAPLAVSSLIGQLEVVKSTLHGKKEKTKDFNQFKTEYMTLRTAGKQKVEACKILAKTYNLSFSTIYKLVQSIA